MHILLFQVCSKETTEAKSQVDEIPGMPPTYRPPPQPTRLKQDDGVYFRDRNAAHYPDFPIEPTVESILQMGSSTEMATAKRPIDIFGCGSTFGNLLRFVRGNGTNFRILVEVVGSTVHLIRREKSPRETIPDVRGYGHSFPETYTTWDPSVRGSSSHQRVIKYRFGGLTCLVRFEGDGYLPGKAGTLAPKAKTVKSSPHPKEKEDESSLEKLLSSVAVSHGTLSSSKPGLQISSAGCAVPQAAVFDLKTRSIYHKDPESKIIAGEMPRLWLRQIPTLILARHQGGVFDDIQIRDVRAETADWERQNANSLGVFAQLLGKIVDFSRQQETGRLEILSNEGDGFLHLRTQTSDIRPALSLLTESRWKAWLEGSSGAAKTVQDARPRGSDTNEIGDEWIDVEELYNDSDGASIDYTACDKECGYCGRCSYNSQRD